MYTGKLKVPRNRSANAMLTTSNKWFLRIFLFFAKIIIVSKFPTTTRINVSVKALHNAMPSPWVPSYASFVSFRRLTLAEDVEDVLVILRQRWRSLVATYVVLLCTVHWPITNANTPLTVTPYWWQISPIKLRGRKFFSLCKFRLIKMMIFMTVITEK